MTDNVEAVGLGLPPLDALWNEVHGVPPEQANEHLRNALQTLGAAQSHSDTQGRYFIDAATKRIWRAIEQIEHSRV